MQEVRYEDSSWLLSQMYLEQLSMDGQQSVRTATPLGCISNMSRDYAEDALIDGIWGVGRSLLRRGNELV
jgi:hypothetical protein